MRDMLFMGRVLASVTHEMQNVMAIIKESGALADDILQLNGPPKMKHGDKLGEAFENIRFQVGRGRDLMLMLNGFAHAAADYPEQGDLVRFTRQISVLAERMVRLKECTLEMALPSHPLSVHGNALMLMQSVYVGLAALLEACEPGDHVLVSIAPQRDGEGNAVVSLGGASSGSVPRCDDLEAIMAELGGGCSYGQFSLELRYPAAPEVTARTDGGAP